MEHIYIRDAQFKSRLQHLFVVFYVSAAGVLSELLQITSVTLIIHLCMEADMSLCVTCFSSPCFPSQLYSVLRIVKVNHLFHIFILIYVACICYTFRDLRTLKFLIQWEVCDVYLPVSADCNLLPLFISFVTCCFIRKCNKMKFLTNKMQIFKNTFDQKTIIQ